MNCLNFHNLVEEDKSALQPARSYTGLFMQYQGAYISRVYERILAADTITNLTDILTDETDSMKAKTIMSPWYDKQGIWKTYQNLPVFLDNHLATATNKEGSWVFPKHATIVRKIGGLQDLKQDLLESHISWIEFFEVATLLGVNLTYIQNFLTHFLASEGKYLTPPFIVSPLDDKYTKLAELKSILNLRGDFTKCPM